VPSPTIDSTIDAAPSDVPIDPVSDAAIDAPPACPTSYTTTLSSTTSRYRVLATAAAFGTHHTACNGHLTGATHLASLETAAEINELRGVLAALGANQYYVGVVQQPNSPTTTSNWFVLTGAQLPSGFFGNSNDDAPGENNEENLGALNTGDLLHDVTGDVAYPAVCECDGKAIDATVAGFIP